MIAVPDHLFGDSSDSMMGISGLKRSAHLVVEQRDKSFPHIVVVKALRRKEPYEKLVEFFRSLDSPKLLFGELAAIIRFMERCLRQEGYENCLNALISHLDLKWKQLQ